jgi:hypothetical protein
MGFRKGDKVMTGTGTQGTVVSEVRHPVSRKTTAVVVDVGNGEGEEIVVRPKNCRRS